MKNHKEVQNMKSKLRKILIVIASVTVLILFFGLYEEFESLKDDTVVGVYEKYKGVQFNIETGESIPLYKKNGKIYTQRKLEVNCKNTLVRKFISEDYGVITIINSLGLATDNGLNFKNVPKEAILCRSVHANMSIAYHLVWEDGDKTYTNDITASVTEPKYR